MKKLLKRGAIASLWIFSIVFVYGLGALVGQHKPEKAEYSSALALSVISILPSQKSCSEGDRTECGFNDTSHRQEVSCTPFSTSKSRQAVIFAFGQSNSANMGEVPHIPLNNNIVNFNPHDGKCYKAEDPLLGPNGNKGSVWAVMADQLIQQDIYDSVLITSIGIGGTEISRWTTGGDLNVRIKHAAKQLLKKNIKPTHVFWHQGSADAAINTSKKDYISMFTAMTSSLREYGIDAPIYPAIATICGNIESEAIRNAQKTLPSRIENVYLGPNSDSLTDSIYRHDSCHFSQKGMRVHAQLWVNAIKPSNLENLTLTSGK